MTQLGHSDAVSSVAFSPDGRWVMTGSKDYTARLWDVATGREVRRFEGHSDPVVSVAFSHNGRWALTGASDSGPDTDVSDVFPLYEKSTDNTARLWDLATGREILRLDGHGASVHSVAFSPDDRLAVTGSSDKSAHLWDLETGLEVRRFEGHSGWIFSVAFSSDGRWVLTGSTDKTARLWDVATGREVRRFEGHDRPVNSVAISPDDRWVLTGSGDRTARLWDVATGRELVQLGRPSDRNADPVVSVAFSPDGRWVLTGGTCCTAHLWDAATGREVRRFDLGVNRGEMEAAFSPDGRLVLTSKSTVNENAAGLWDAATGHEVRRLEGYRSSVHSVGISPDGRWALTGSREHGVALWDLSTGREARHLDAGGAATFSPDGKWVLSSGQDHTAQLWDVTTGREVRRFEGHGDWVTSAAFSRDGRRALTGSDDGTARLWDVATGRQVRRIKVTNFPDFGVQSVDLSPNGRWALTGSWDKTVRLWDLTTGLEVRHFEGHTGPVFSVAFSHDGRWALTAGDDGTARFWDVATGREVRRIGGNLVAFSPDGRKLLTATENTARVWDVATLQELCRLESHGYFISSATFSSDGRWVLVGNHEGTLQFFDTIKNQLAATAMTLAGGGWAVADTEGRYDASDPDNTPGLYWLLGDEVIELRQLKERFYSPHLLARALGFNKEELPAVAGLDDLQLWPTVEVIPPQPGDTKATVKLTNRGGGIGDVMVKVNGREIELKKSGSGFDPDAKKTEFQVDLAAAELAADGKNQIEVIANDGANLVSGRGLKLDWERAPENRNAPATLHAIVVGVSLFPENPKLNLRFPAKDAADMAQAIRVGGAHLFGLQHVDVRVFASGGENEPTKQNIRRAFEDVAAHAGPNDVVLVYFAGHGIAGSKGSDAYYFLTREARGVETNADAVLRATTTVSSAELLDWLRRKGMPLRQVVVLDTCAAGQAANELIKLGDRRELTADQRRAIELLKDRTGSHILMGAAANKVSYEASRYGQGLLTYALLSGMRGEALDNGGRLDVRRWFDTAEHRVPELALGIGGIQEPVVSSPIGQSFPIALITKEDFERIPLARIKPQLLHVRCNDDDDADPIGLEAALSTELRAASMPSTRGGQAEAPLVYLDEVGGDVADAYSPRVHYWIEQGRVRLRLRLELGARRVETTIEVPSKDVATIAKLSADKFITMAERGQP